VVNSIFNRSELLVALGGLAGLICLLRYLECSPTKAWLGLGLAYLFVLFCRESGIVLPGLAVLLVLVLTPGTLQARIRKCLPVFWLLIPLALYVALRLYALAPDEVAGSAEASGVTGVSGMGGMLDRFEMPAGRRLLRLAGLWYESFKIMLWPYPLSIEHHRIPYSAQMTGVVLNIALVMAAIYLFKHKRYGLITGLAFFYIALLPASRIVGDPGVGAHLAERYLYFPSVGLAIVLAFGLRYLARRFDFLVAASVVLVAVIVLTPLTWARNAVWASEVRLLESEYNNGNHTPGMLGRLTAALLRESAHSRVEEICDRYIEIQE
jgi:hypothetical protein